jgi:ATP-dependent exoDNAse (exonuclease V) alpha subunit
MRLQTAAAEYLKKHRRNTVVIVESNSERKDLNEMIRQKLQAKGQLGRVRMTAMTRQPGNLPLQERQLSQAYKKGDSFFLSEKIGDISAGSGGRVVHVDQVKNTIDAIVKDRGSSIRVTIDLSKDGHRLSTFKEELRSFARGDKIIFLKNDKKLKVENGTTAKVVRVNPLDNNLTVLTDKRQRIVLNPGSYPYIDYGYATTNYKVQGLTAEEVLYVADTRTNPSYNSLYVAATRGKHGLDILTNDKDVLREKVQIEEVKSSNLDYDLEPQLQIERSLDREMMD